MDIKISRKIFREKHDSVRVRTEEEYTEMRTVLIFIFLSALIGVTLFFQNIKVEMYYE